MSCIEPKSVRELQGYNFFVPSYQRGYRWNEQQVKDLMIDIYDFIEQGAKGIYCIQPLVVIKKDNHWHVIDGQQRLTTIFILLSCLGEHIYDIEYETRPNSTLFLRNINNQESASMKALSNIDFYHMDRACHKINSLLQVAPLNFKSVLHDKVKFIWYSIDVEANPIEVFTRLNIDKISLTSSELIKALLLNRNNYNNNGNVEKIHLLQQEIASEWDAIENQFQKDAFWLFFGAPVKTCVNNV